MKKIHRDTKGLRKHLFQTLEDLRQQSIGTDHARAVVAIANVIVRSVELDMDYYRTVCDQRVFPNAPRKTSLRLTDKI